MNAGPGSRREFLKVVGGSAASLALSGLGCSSRAGSPRKNFVIAIADDLGWGDLACYGHPIVETPHLDRLAAEGMRLTAHYAPAVNCSPSRAGLLTGRIPRRTGVWDWIPKRSELYLPPDELTIPTLLRQGGYATCLVGKWHLSGSLDGEGQPGPSEHGFDHWFATRNVASPPIDPTSYLEDGRPVERTRGPAAFVIVERAVRWLEALPRDVPFCLFVCFHEPHARVATLEEYRQPYLGRGDPRAATYYGCVSHMDRAFGQLLAALDARGVADETVVWFTSDNGPSRKPGSHGSTGYFRGKKSLAYEGGIRVPGIVRWPGGIPAGAVSHEPVNGTDLLPTLLAIAGVDPPSDRAIDGADVLPILTGGRVRREHPLLWHFRRDRYAMRDGDWKLLAGRRGFDAELYDLGRDAGERRNLVLQERERTRRMLGAMRALVAEVEVEGLRKRRRWQLSRQRRAPA